ncbi:TrmB family transcriptional regulator [Methanobrevibacter filiformis]|uniref:Sugar-specific transcriptional regulator TrmB n=1 Tax=Methanobrevibacter filiformis TaxID=55758 RepID=A0A166CHR2_9EURY|nr:helix-turn-helix domain-containing protein [Methanobrevibacter filiformis]KZX14467.1 sugar-specific transcriptional regulator TrmB [Methanobrevibacter filiformis]
MENKILKSLKIFGLNEYESNSYLALNYIITGTATEISEKANVPRSRIYDILRSLVQKGFIEQSPGRPINYQVIPPKEVFKLRKNKIINELEESEIELNEIYEDQLSKAPAPVWLIHGDSKIIKKELEIISRAKKSVNIRMGFMFKEEGEKLKEKINKAVKKGVEINIMASPYCFVDNHQINIINELKSTKADVFKFSLPFAKMIVGDSREMIHIFTKFSGENNVISSTAIGVWNQYEDIAKSYDDRFMMQWKKKIKNNKNKHRIKNKN